MWHARHLIHSNELLLLYFLRKGWKTSAKSHVQKRWWHICLSSKIAYHSGSSMCFSHCYKQSVNVGDYYALHGMYDY